MTIDERDEDGGETEDKAAAETQSMLNTCGVTALCLDLIAPGIHSDVKVSGGAGRARGVGEEEEWSGRGVEECGSRESGVGGVVHSLSITPHDPHNPSCRWRPSSS